MNIVLEGPDGSGKSTLASVIMQHVPLRYQGTEGPEKWPGEAIERAYRYLKMDGVLFDRHVIISQNIYGRHRQGATMIPPELVTLLYTKKHRPLFIYCSGGSLETHDPKSLYDTKDHLELVQRYDSQIRGDYSLWAISHANITYKMGDDLTPIIKACKDFCK